jgi:hypothetical protein
MNRVSFPGAAALLPSLFIIAEQFNRAKDEEEGPQA